MKKNRWLLRAVLLLAISAMLNMTLSAAADAGSSGDPLVTLSYLNETFLTSVLSKVDGKITERNTAMTAKIQQAAGNTAAGEADSFTLVSLEKGKTLTGSIGCEVLLRVGSATCVAASSPGLVDETAGTTLSGGKALGANHLYMMTVEDRGVRAATAAKLLVRGSYTVG
jgi:hypothetical protein